jgi:hypothetical protein
MYYSKQLKLFRTFIFGIILLLLSLLFWIVQSIKNQNFLTINPVPCFLTISFLPENKFNFPVLRKVPNPQ